MTDEQIKQNAEEYAKAHTPLDNWETDKALAKFAFISGAHSRDEEIKELEDRNKVLDMNLVEQQLENLQLSNPWISVEERLPEKGRWVVLIGSKTGHPYVNKYTGGRKWGGWRCFMPKVTKWKYVDE